LVSILTANASSVPLDYIGSAPIAVTVAGPNSLNAALSPIIAKAVPSYVFEKINGGNVSLPLIAAAVYDASGDPAIMTATSSPYSLVNVSQTVGNFDTIAELNSGQGGYDSNGPISAGTVAQFPYPTQHGGFALELGNGTTTAFTTVVSLSTPLVQFTQTEFPQLAPAGLTVPASANSITLTCLFPSSPIVPPGLSSDPCPGTAPVNINLF
jgi:hypothetical protein